MTCAHFILKLESGRVLCQSCDSVLAGRTETAKALAKVERERVAERVRQRELERCGLETERRHRKRLAEERRDLARRKVEALEAMACGLQRSGHAAEIMAGLRAK